MAILTCPEAGCGYSTNRKNNLARHHRKHTGAFPRSGRGDDAREIVPDVLDTSWLCVHRLQAVRLPHRRVHLPLGGLVRAPLPSPRILDE